MNQNERRGGMAGHGPVAVARGWAGPVPVVGLALLMGLITVAVHWPVLSARALTIDDQQYLTDNQLIQNPSWESARRFLTEVLQPTTVAGYYQPLAMISLMLDFAQARDVRNLRPFHRTSLALHALNTALVVLLLQQLLGRLWLAGLVGLLFGVHPVTVEPVAWVGERKTVLATAFALGCLVVYVRYARRPRPSSYLGTHVLFLAALLSKPTTTTLPVLLLLLDWWPLRRLGKRALIEKIPLLALAVAGAVVTYVSQARACSVLTPAQRPLLHILWVLCHNVLFYLGKFAWPANLAPFYDFPKPLGLSHPMVLAGVLGTIVLIALLVVSLRWTRTVAAGGLFFLVAIFPTMGVIGFNFVIAADKYFYFPVFGLLLVLTRALGALVDFAIRRWSRSVAQTIVVALGCALAAGEGALTRRQLACWQTTEGLYRQMLRVSPDAAAVHNDLAVELLRQGRTTDAMHHFHEAVRAEPDAPLPRYGLAIELLKQGNVGEALDQFGIAVAAALNPTQMRNNFALMLSQTGHGDLAVAQFQEILRATPHDQTARFNLAVELGKQGRSEEAVAQYRELLKGSPRAPVVHYNLALELAEQGHTPEAIEHLQAALHGHPEPYLVLNNLGALLLRAGRPEEALLQFRAAVRANARAQPAYVNLARALLSLNRIDEAIDVLEEGLRITPEDPQLHALREQARSRRATTAPRPP